VTEPVAVRTLAARIVLCALGLAAPAFGAVDPVAATPPRMEFVPPAPGQYRLQRIQRVADAVLLDPFGRARHLSQSTRGKVTLLTFFYASCSDPLGCPFAYGTMHRLRARLATAPGVSGNVRFVSVSIDPTHDTPQALSDYARMVAPNAAIDWQFMTARSIRALLPVLDDFGQDVAVEVNAQGQPTRVTHHMLKMFLIDRTGTVREIYSLAFIQPDVIANDVLTLLMEPKAPG
jgi:cytochrome oxidase Cu insertion factor (SCO1/SenC/PrrC family)